MEIIREYDWNGKHYVLVDIDGNQVELKCNHEDVSNAATKVMAAPNVKHDVPPIGISDFTDDVILTEVARRKLDVPIIARAL